MRQSPYRHKVSTHKRVVKGRPVPVTDYVRGEGSVPTKPEYMARTPTYLEPATQEVDETLREEADPFPYLTVRSNAGKGDEAEITAIVCEVANNWIKEKNIHRITSFIPSGRETDFVNAVIAAIWDEDLIREINSRMDPEGLKAVALKAGYYDPNTYISEGRNWLRSYIDVVDAKPS